MSTDTLKKFRPASLVLSAIGVISAIIAVSFQQNILFLAASLLAFTSISYFLFTEAFLFGVSVRSKLNIWAARIFFVLALPVIFGIAASLLLNHL